MTDQIFKDQSVFERADTPKPVARDWEIRRAVSEFQHELLNVTAPSAIFYGMPGLGKSSLLKATCTTLQTLGERQDVDIEIISVNCDSIDAPRQLYFEILRQQGHDTSQNTAPEKRKYTTFSSLTGEIRRQIIDRDADIYVFALDDIDTIDKPATAFKTLLRMDEEYGDLNVALLATSFRRDILDNDHRFTRKYRPTEINIGYPDNNDFRAALEANVKAGLHKDSITENAFQTLVEWSVQRLSIGEAVTVLQRTGQFASDSAADQITKEHVEKVIADHQMWFGISWLLDRQLGIHNQAILLALANNEEQVTHAETLYGEYDTIITDTASEPLSYEQFHAEVTGEILDPFLCVEEPSCKTEEGQHQDRQNDATLQVKLKDDPEAVYTALSNEVYQDLPDTHLPDVDGTHFRHFQINKSLLLPTLTEPPKIRR